MNPYGPYIDVEVAYRQERLSADFPKTRRQHRHPVRALGRVISRVHDRIEGV